MMMLTTLVFIMLIVSGVLAVLIFGLKKESLFDWTHLSGFECGFSSAEESRLPFSLRFFLVMLVFLIFDIEMILLFPFFLAHFSGVSYSILTFEFILIVLSVGLYFEWNLKSLEWSE